MGLILSFVDLLGKSIIFGLQSFNYRSNIFVYFFVQVYRTSSQFHNLFLILFHFFNHFLPGLLSIFWHYQIAISLFKSYIGYYLAKPRHVEHEGWKITCRGPVDFKKHIILAWNYLFSIVNPKRIIPVSVKAEGRYTVVEPIFIFAYFKIFLSISRHLTFDPMRGNEYVPYFGFREKIMCSTTYG